MSKRPLGITFFSEDWTRPIQSLPPLEFGVLVRLALQSIDSTEPGTLPNNDRNLAFRAGLSVGEWAAVRPALSEFMEIAGETVRFPTIKRRYDSAAAFKRRQADHARKRWDGSLMPPSCHPHATHERPMSDPHTSEFCVPVPSQEGNKNTHAGAREASRAFDRNHAVREILAAYPVNNGHGSPKAVRDALYELGGLSANARFGSEAEAAAWLLERVRLYAASVKATTTPPQYRKSVAQWLREGMYDSPDAEWAVPYATEEPAHAAPPRRSDAELAEQARRNREALASIGRKP